jgi:tRNA(fMet)-specific endonuclease VapC
MDRYLLDTNILSHVIRFPSGPVRQRLADLTPEARCTSIVVAAELRFGAIKENSARLSATVESVLARLQVFAFSPPADRIYAEIRAKLERRGTPLAANDLLIAAHALALGCILVSDDRAFARVPGLKLENWIV